MIHVVTFILDRSDLPGSSANLTRALALNLQTPTTSPAFTAVWNQLAPLHPSDADSDAEDLVEDTDTPNRIQQLENELSTKQVQLIKTKRDESRLSRGLVQLIGRARNQEARDAQAQDSLAQEHQAQMAALHHELAAERSKTTKVREDRRIAQEARRIAEEKARELEAQNAALQDSVQAERHRHQIERDHHLAQWEADRQANNDQRIKAIEADYTQRLEQKEAELALARDAVAAAEQGVLEADQTQASIEAERLKQLEAQHLLKTEAQAAEKEQRRRARKEKEAAHKRKHNELINAIPVQEEDVSQTAKELQQAKLDGQIRAENQEILILVTRTMKQHFLGNQDERVVLAEIKGRLDEVGRMFEQGANLQDAVASGGAVFNKLSDIQVDEISTSTVRRQVPGAYLVLLHQDLCAPGAGVLVDAEEAHGSSRNSHQGQPVANDGRARELGVSVPPGMALDCVHNHLPSQGSCAPEVDGGGSSVELGGGAEEPSPSTARFHFGGTVCSAARRMGCRRFTGPSDDGASGCTPRGDEA